MILAWTFVYETPGYHHMHIYMLKAHTVYVVFVHIPFTVYATYNIMLLKVYYAVCYNIRQCVKDMCKPFNYI